MPDDNSVNAREICEKAPVIPVLVIDDVAHAEPLAEALVSGGLPILEVTLRTNAALDVIKAMSHQEGATVGAGTILSPADMHAAIDAGAKFGVSPGCTDELLDASQEAKFPMLPGAATSKEIMHLLSRGYNMLKFFPAEIIGGVGALKSYSSVFSKVGFCPTGGVNMKNATDYLSLPNVVCVGGSWIAPKEELAAGNWDEVRRLASAAAALHRS